MAKEGGCFFDPTNDVAFRKLFGDNSWRSLPQAWLVGMLLPVCSLGVIPVIREMRRAARASA